MSLTLKETDTVCCFDLRINRVVYFETKEDHKQKPVATEHRGHLEILPRKPNVGTENENIFVCGASGSGKTYVLRTYACNYKRLHPTNKIYMITQSKEEKLPDSCKVFTATMRDSKRTYAEFLDLQYIDAYTYFKDKKDDEQVLDITRDYKECLVIFDDFVYFAGKNKNETKTMRDNINLMILQILNLGRKIGVSCLITSHLLYDRKYNELFQNIYSEINKLCFSPDNINKRQLSYILKSYFSFNGLEIRRTFKFDDKTHMITYNKKPAFLLSENKIELMEDL